MCSISRIKIVSIIIDNIKGIITVFCKIKVNWESMYIFQKYTTLHVSSNWSNIWSIITDVAVILNYFVRYYHYIM